MASSMRFDLNRAGIDRLVTSPTSVYAQTFLPRVGNQIVNRAKIRANVDTGLMRSRIEFRLDTTTRPPSGIVAAKTRYSRWVHDGNGRYAGNPFLRLAAQDVLG